jgi:tRNA isopentenyl-2-thiomethyl-A-37 hydroxylase MiaE
MAIVSDGLCGEGEPDLKKSILENRNVTRATVPADPDSETLRARARRRERRRLLSMLTSDAARGARQYVARFRAGRGAE